MTNQPTSDAAPPTTHLPERHVPVPTSVSAEAQAILAMGPLAPPPEWPALHDPETWRALVDLADQGMVAMAQTEGPLGYLRHGDADADLEERDLGGFLVNVVTPRRIEPNDPRTYLDIHGGAWVYGGGEVCRLSARLSAATMGTRIWAVDYRMPPDHPYPTPLDDCLAAYRALLEEREPDEIVVGGSSAGANLAAALVIRARDEGLPMPAALVLETGAFDLTASGDSHQTNLGLDTVLTGDFSPCVQLYAGDEDLRHPYVSPLFADLTGLPPTIITTGTRDLLLSDNVRMHRALLAAGVHAELHVWEAAGHGNFLRTAPEDDERSAQVRSFAEARWGVASAELRGRP